MFKPGKPTEPKYLTTAHRQARTRLLAAFTPGDPCCLCGHPMWPAPDGSTSNLHADHLPGTDRYRGLAHARCNVRDGAKRGRARRKVTRLTW